MRIIVKDELKPADETIPAGEQKPPQAKWAKESIYDRIPLSKKQLNIIIIVLVIAIIFFLVMGALIGNGII